MMSLYWKEVLKKAVIFLKFFFNAFFCSLDGTEKDSVWKNLDLPAECDWAKLSVKFWDNIKFVFHAFLIIMYKEEI